MPALALVRPYAIWVRPFAPLRATLCPTARPVNPLAFEFVRTAREVVERLTETINAHDLSAGRALYAEDARLVPASGQAIDLDGLDAMMGASFAAMSDLTMRVVRWIEAGDIVVTEDLMEATAPNGSRLSVPMAHITRVVGGHIVERVAYHDTAVLMRALTGS